MMFSWGVLMSVGLFWMLVGVFVMVGRWIRCAGFLVRGFGGWVFGGLWLIGCVLLFMASVIMVE